MVSVIIPSLNQGDVLPETVNLILGQSYSDLEIIIVDDGSDDETEANMKSFLNKVLYFKRAHEGRQQARNFGLSQARGNFLLVCDADIKMRKDMIEKMVQAMEEHPDISFVYSGFKWGWKTFQSFPFDNQRLREMNYINMASLVRKESHPGFDEKIGRLQDWDVWLTIAEKGGSGLHLPEILFSVHSHKGGLSTWLPSFLYTTSIVRRLGLKIETLESYEHWKRIVQEKHGITV